MDGRESMRAIWRKFEFASITAAVVTVLFVIIGQSAEQLAFSVVGGNTQVGVVKPQFNAIDYASTGAVAKGPVVIGPCATRQP